MVLLFWGLLDVTLLFLSCLSLTQIPISLQVLELLVLCPDLLVFWRLWGYLLPVYCQWYYVVVLEWKLKNYAVSTIFPESSIHLILIPEVWCGLLVWPLQLLLNPFFSDNLVVNVPLHILLFHARMIHLLFKTRPYQLNLCFINTFNISCIYLTNLPYFNSTSTQELCHSQYMLPNYVAINLS